jgi:SAM-dependent methyltransferase
MTAPAVLFDALAADYDRAFTRTQIGGLMRAAVWARCAARFAPGARILEMNCGTGEDARWLAQRGCDVLATDISPAMLAQARHKLAAGARVGQVRYRPLAWEQLAALDEAPFDGVLSNFGGLNCVADLDAAAAGLAATLRRGGMALLCVMGPCVPWEWAWYLSHGRGRKAFRRLHAGGCDWQGLTIRYPSVRRLRHHFDPQFQCLRVAALGALLPPPYSEVRLGRRPRLLRALNRLERRFEACWPLPQLADHYLIELQRR